MRVHERTKVTITFDMELSEDEAAALVVITGWSPESLATALTGVCGASIAREHQRGLVQFFGSVREQLGPPIEAVRNARALLRKAQEHRAEAASKGV